MPKCASCLVCLASIQLSAGLLWFLMAPKGVGGADTTRLDLTPQSAGRYAISRSLSATFADDHEMLKHGMVL